MPVSLSAGFLLLLACHQMLAVELRDVQEKQGSQVKKRLSLQSTARGADQEELSSLACLKCFYSIQSLRNGFQNLPTLVSVFEISSKRTATTRFVQLTPYGTAAVRGASGALFCLHSFCLPSWRSTSGSILSEHIPNASGSFCKLYNIISVDVIVEIQSCLVSSGDVGCGMFQCFNNNSCEIQGLHHICLTLLHNAGHYDSQGKSFVKDALRCMALGLRQRFSCVSRRCSAVKEMVFLLQRECYTKHNLCLALQDHVDTMGNLVQFHLMFPTGPYVELMNFLLKCGDEMREWVGRRLRGQCEQQWGALCSSFTDLCPHSQSDGLQYATTPQSVVPWPITAQGSLQLPTGGGGLEDTSEIRQMDRPTVSGLPQSEQPNTTVS